MGGEFKLSTARVSLLASLVPLLLPAIVQAGLTAPASQAEVSSSGKRILVFIHPDPAYDQRIGGAVFRMPDGRELDLRKTFSQSGVYTLPDLKLVWPIDWFSYGHEILANDDFSRMVRVNRFSRGDEWAISFVKNGEEIGTRTFNELLVGFRKDRYFPLQSWDWHPSWYDPWSFELTESEFRFSTANRLLPGTRFTFGYQEHYRFDLDGRLVAAEIDNDDAIRLALVIAGIFASGVGIGFRLFLFKGKGKEG